MHLDPRKVSIKKCSIYDDKIIQSALPDDLFDQIYPGDKVVIKPNWVLESHKKRKEDWNYVITHPTVITAVIKKVIKKLQHSGKISIIDGPMTETCFNELIAHFPEFYWKELAQKNNIELEIIDLRDYEWVMKNGVIVERKSLPGDPRGKVLADLFGKASEFWGHKKSQRGYYGADYDRTETNCAHDGYRNLYSVSRTVIESDIFINIPKLKTHAKAGITCCLKNLVGINTYKNYLPHHSEGSPDEGGDQFQTTNLSVRLEGPLMSFIKQYILTKSNIARIVSPLKQVALRILGDSGTVIRNGSWYGNDTVWRMILDLNKILFHLDTNGNMTEHQLFKKKRYIGVVDAVLAGEGDGPLSPDPIRMGYIICGINPVAIDFVCSYLMGFDPMEIKSIKKAFEIREYKLCDFDYNQIIAILNGTEYRIGKLPKESIVPFKPHFGWCGRIEKGSGFTLHNNSEKSYARIPKISPSKDMTLIKSKI